MIFHVKIVIKTLSYRYNLERHIKGRHSNHLMVKEIDSESQEASYKRHERIFSYSSACRFEDLILQGHYILFYFVEINLKPVKYFKKDS